MLLYCFSFGNDFETNKTFKTHASTSELKLLKEMEKFNWLKTKAALC